MSYRRFLSFELLAALIWNIGFSVLGYLAGAEYEHILQVVERAGWIIAGVVVLAILVWKVGLPWLRKRRHTAHHHSATGKSAD